MEDSETDQTQTVRPVSLRAVREAQQRIKPFTRQTPVINSPALSVHTGADVFLKLETMQPTRSFKVRGAANTILALTPAQRTRGVTTFSTGNHGQAVAYVAQQLGLRAVVCISPRVPRAKVDAIERLGAELEIVGDSQDDAERHCYQLGEEHGLTVVKPFDDPWIICGQGTIGLELLSQVPQLDAVLVPLSGGGLISGIAYAVKSLRPSVRIIGVSADHATAMYDSLQAGQPVTVQEQSTLADSLLGGIGLENQYTLDLVRRHVDRIVLVSEDTIRQGMDFMRDRHALEVEGAAATGIGALLQHKVDLAGLTVAVIISGGNVDPAT